MHLPALHTVTTLTLLLLLPTTLACDTYRYGWCVNSDGTANNDITKKACIPPGYYGNYGNSFDECRRYKRAKNRISKGINNCHWRTKCVIMGGFSGFCHGKIGILRRGELGEGNVTLALASGEMGHGEEDGQEEENEDIEVASGY